MKSQDTALNTQAVNLQPATINQRKRGIKPRNLIYLFALVVAMMFSALPLPAHAAGPLTPVQLASEMMMHSQADAAGFIAAQIGVDPNSHLNYSSYVDPAGQSFSFSLNSGTTYLGQPLALSASGTFAPSTHTWNVLYSALYGRTQWTINSSLVLSVGPVTSVTTATSVTSWNSGGLGIDTFNGANGENCTPTVWSAGLIHSSAYCYFTHNGAQDGPGFWLYDEFNVIEQIAGWSVSGNSQYWNFSHYTVGSIPASGGLGSFVSVVGPAEPACTTCSAGGSSDSN